MIKQLFSSSKRRTTAQAMVEFALALPVLLLVIYGLIETGRLIFIYASVVTAARQASRYGSATGVNTGRTPYYEDCTGITAAANSVAFINAFSSIQITYDHGLDSSGNPVGFVINNNPNQFPSCVNPWTSGLTLANGDRINVQVSAQYSPIVPLVPFKPFTITSSSSRTLLVSIPITVTSVPQSLTTSGLSLQKIPFPTTYDTPGQQITYSYNISNTGSSNVPGPITISDNKIANVSCPSGDLAAGASMTCTATYTITQADIDGLSISNTALALSSSGSSNVGAATVTAILNPKITLSKTGELLGSIDVGQPINYTYTLQNTGNMTLTSPYTITDDLVSTKNITCPTSDLAPGNSITCTGTYSITSKDINAGSVTNNASATAIVKGNGATTPPSNTASATVLTPPILLTITTDTASVTALNQVVTYTYRIKNPGTTNVSSPFTVTDNRITGITCPTGTITPGNSITCTGTHQFGQGDFDAGPLFIDQATATAQNSKNKTISSNPFSFSEPIALSFQLSLTKTANPTTQYVKGQNVTYTYVLMNTSNVTLTAPFAVADNKVATIGCPATPTSLAPNATITCGGGGALGGVYAITQADIDTGFVINQATATANYGGQIVTSNQASATVLTYNGARLTLKKTANTATYSAAGQTVTYTYTLINSGNVTLNPPFAVTDSLPLVSGVTCPSSSPIAPATSTTCTGTYVTTSTDMSNGSVGNTATATAVNSATSTTITSNQASLTITALGPVACDVRHSALKTAPFSMTIFNFSSTATISIAEIDIYYNNASPQAITSLTFGGSPIWSGSISTNPGVFKTFSGSVSISPGSNAGLIVFFGQPYSANGTERITVTFNQIGCPVLDSSNAGQYP